jgi:hypothetical protein
VDVRAITINGHQRQALFQHPPSEVRLPLTVPPQAVFATGLGIDPRSWDETEADGVRFVAEVRRESGETRRVLDEELVPQQRVRDRGWRFALVDLGAFAGEHVTLTLRTVGRETPFFDWASWASPVVYVDNSARYPPLPQISNGVPGRVD